MNKTYTAMAFLLAAGSFIFSPLSFAEQDDKKAEIINLCTIEAEDASDKEAYIEECVTAKLKEQEEGLEDKAKEES